MGCGLEHSKNQNRERSRSTQAPTSHIERALGEQAKQMIAKSVIWCAILLAFRIDSNIFFKLNAFMKRLSQVYIDQVYWICPIHRLSELWQHPFRGSEMFRTVCPLAVFHQGGGLFRKAKHFALRSISAWACWDDCAFLNSLDRLNYCLFEKKSNCCSSERHPRHSWSCGNADESLKKPKSAAIPKSPDLQHMHR